MVAFVEVELTVMVIRVELPVDDIVALVDVLVV